MGMCEFAKFCGKRMAHGDREHGCSDLDQVSCDPNHRAGTITAPAGAIDKPYQKCTNCYRTRSKREWNAGAGPRMCDCGAYSWIAVIA